MAGTTTAGWSAAAASIFGVARNVGRLHVVQSSFGLRQVACCVAQGVVDRFYGAVRSDGAHGAVGAVAFARR